MGVDARFRRRSSNISDLSLPSTIEVQRKIHSSAQNSILPGVVVRICSEVPLRLGWGTEDSVVRRGFCGLAFRSANARRFCLASSVERGIG